ncbi:hypothetical protein AAMO2058_000034900 [Amorphochlora amoebiformis]
MAAAVSDVGLSIKVKLVVADCKCSETLAANILKANGRDVEKAKAWLSDPKNKEKIAAMNRLASYGPSLAKLKSAKKKPSVSSGGDNKMDSKLRLKGKCVQYNKKKGYGFIKPAGGGKDVFVYQTSIKAKGFRSLAAGEEVEFEVIERNGRTEAINVTGPRGVEVKGAQNEAEGPSDIAKADEAEIEKKIKETNLKPSMMFMPRGMMRKKPAAKGVWLRPGAKKKVTANLTPSVMAPVASASVSTSSNPPPKKRQRKSRWS